MAIGRSMDYQTSCSRDSGNLSLRKAYNNLRFVIIFFASWFGGGWNDSVTDPPSSPPCVSHPHLALLRAFPPLET
jgi:hypothetical protein